LKISNILYLLDCITLSIYEVLNFYEYGSVTHVFMPYGRAFPASSAGFSTFLGLRFDAQRIGKAALPAQSGDRMGGNGDVKGV